MGGKSHITCKCCQFPLIPSSKIKLEKSQCNLKRYLQDNNSEIQTTLACTRKESFVCSNVNCNLRVCNKCYKSFPEDKMTMIIPETSNAIDYEDNISFNENPTNEILDEESSLLSSSSSDEDNLFEEDNVEENFAATHVVFSNQDPTLNQTQDNINADQGFFTTHSGDSPVNILQDQKKTISYWPCNI